jgi:protoporphyrinogen oxidase
MSDQVGGIARTETYNGYRFDIGGHRFYTKVGEVEALWHEVMGDDFLEVERLSRIYYDENFFLYPLDLWNTLGNLGLVESFKILYSYVKTQVDPPYDEEKTFEQWVTNRFGERLYQMFFKTYTEKVWGIPCSEIRADWAAQRIKKLDLVGAIRKAIFGGGDETSLINEFYYPKKGPGQMWQRFQRLVRGMDGEVRMNSKVTRLEHTDHRRIDRVVVDGPDTEYALDADDVINSMPINELIFSLDPTPPSEVMEAAQGLNYRDFLIVTLILDKEDVFPDNWIYIHSPKVKVGRIQNFKNWSPHMVPDDSKTCLGMEYFCSEGDALWESGEEELLEKAERELRTIGLGEGAEVLDGTVIRQKKTYPVYDAEYKDHLDVIYDYLDQFENLQTVGRAGMHRYNNQDHSMLTAMLAARNVMGEEHDIWNVNVERSYHEDFTVEEKEKKRKEMEKTREEVRDKVGDVDMSPDGSSNGAASSTPSNGAPSNEASSEKGSKSKEEPKSQPASSS